MPRIDSVNNPEVKALASLQRAKGRLETGLFLIEGPHLVEEALLPREGQGGTAASISAVYYTAGYVASAGGADLLVRLDRTGARFVELSDAAFAKASETETPQGILAVARIPRASLADVPSGRPVLLLDRLQDPGNLGTILRTAAAAGAAGVLLTEGSADPFSGKAVRASQGAIFHLPMVTGVQVGPVVQWARAAGRAIACTSPRDGRDYFEAALAGQPLMVLGSEAHGVSGELFQSADVLVRIPIIGRAESLNVASAAAVLLYEAYRQEVCRRRPCQ